MIRQYVNAVGTISAIFGLVLVTDSLETSLSIGTPLVQYAPDWAWALAFCLCACATVGFNNRNHRCAATIAMQLLTVLWVAVTVPRIINLLPSSVLYVSMTLFCIRTYIAPERRKTNG